MRKKVLATLLAATMTAALFAGCGNSATNDQTDADGNKQTQADGGNSASGDKVITIWAADAVADLTRDLATAFLSENYPDFSVVVEPVSESEAATNIITDISAGADIFGFAQDQLSRLVAAGALQPLTPDYTTWVQENNDGGASSAATLNDVTYAFPLTSDNGYFLIYNKSIVSDPTSLEQILADCEAAGANFYMEADSAWYNAAFFFATGAECTFDTDSEGNVTEANVSYASQEGLIAYRKLLEVCNSSAFVNSSTKNDVQGTLGAIIDGVWDIADSEVEDENGDTYTSPGLKTLLGDDYACAKLPSFTGSDGKEYQLSGFGGFKLMGIKRQTDADKLAVCYALTQYLTDTDAQLARYESQGWGPSNLVAQENEAVQADEALAALAEQLNFCIPQGQYTNEWWDLAGGLVKDENGYLSTSLSDDELMAKLQLHDDTCRSYCQ